MFLDLVFNPDRALIAELAVCFYLDETVSGAEGVRQAEDHLCERKVGDLADTLRCKVERLIVGIH